MQRENEVSRVKYKTTRVAFICHTVDKNMVSQIENFFQYREPQQWYIYIYEYIYISGKEIVVIDIASSYKNDTYVVLIMFLKVCQNEVSTSGSDAQHTWGQMSNQEILGIKFSKFSRETCRITRRSVIWFRKYLTHCQREIFEWKFKYVISSYL